MTPMLATYLSQVYRRDILGESVRVEIPVADPALIAEIKAEIARIDALRLGANLANRDFVSYQNRQALQTLLDQLAAQPEEQPLPGG